MGVQFQPVFVVAFNPVDFSVLAGKVAEGAENLAIVLQAVHTVIFGEGALQVWVEKVVGGVANSEDVDAVFMEADAKPAVGFWEIRGNENKIHGKPS